MSRIFPVWMEYLWAVLVWLVLCIPGELLARLAIRFIRTTRRRHVIISATMRAFLLAPVLFTGMDVSIYPFPIALLQYVSGDGSDITVAKYAFPLLVTFLLALAMSHARAELQWMEGKK